MNMSCYLCASKNIDLIHKGTRTNPNINVLKCKDCGLVFLDKQTNLDYYINNGLKEDTIIDTMEHSDIERRFTQFKFMFQNKRILDFGCGNGAFLNKLKEITSSYLLWGLEINKKYRQNLFKQVNLFLYIKNIPNNYLDVITMFHVLEHLSDPINTLNQLYDKLKKDGKLIIEVPNIDDILISYWKHQSYLDFIFVVWHNYYFNARTFENLVKKTPFQLLYIEHIQRYPLSNHIYWLKENKPGGHIKEMTYINENYNNMLASRGQTDTLIGILSK